MMWCVSQRVFVQPRAYLCSGSGNLQHESGMKCEMNGRTINACALEDLACLARRSHTVTFDLVAPQLAESVWCERRPESGFDARASRMDVSHLSLPAGLAVHGLARLVALPPGGETVDANLLPRDGNRIASTDWRQRERR
jgi:hypothetical protein